MYLRRTTEKVRRQVDEFLKGEGHLKIFTYDRFAASDRIRIVQAHLKYLKIPFEARGTVTLVGGRKIIVLFRRKKAAG